MTEFSAVKYVTAVTLICAFLRPGWSQEIHGYSQGDDITSEKSCIGDQFRCRNGDCIESELLCDGRADCTDESDETDASCALFPCSQRAFRCKYGACIDSDLKCNNIANCADGSDEDPILCGSPEPEPSTKRLQRAAWDLGQTTLRPRPCPIPPQPRNGYWKLHKSLCGGISGTEVNCNIDKGIELNPGTRLVFGCNRGYRLTGGTNVYCEHGGSWSSLPDCIESKCSVLNSPSTIASCTTRLGDWISCDSLAPSGTRAEVTCRPGYRKDTNFITTQTNAVSCNLYGKWEPGPIKCVPGPLTIYVVIEEGVIKVKAKVVENSNGVDLIDVTNDKVIVYTGQHGDSEREPNIKVMLNVPSPEEKRPQKLVEAQTWS